MLYSLFFSVFLELVIFNFSAYVVNNEEHGLPSGLIFFLY